jgi:sugar/nucleoside kinase (ribokinase family)
VTGPIVTVGEIVVEVMAVRAGQSLRAPGPLVGPFPSGAPAIFIDQVAMLGYPCGIVSCVGDDEFGHLNVDRLRADGVDVSAIEVLRDEVTGSAFVTYATDGSRSFVYNIERSASGRIEIDAAAERLLTRAGHLHVTGSSLFSTHMAEVITRAVHMVKSGGGTVSLDPNIRRELLTTSVRRDALARIAAQCDLFLPSDSEVTALTTAEGEAAAIQELLGMGVTAVVIKHGAHGSRYVDSERSVVSPPLPVDEVDPTGAGDRFAAGFVVSWLRGDTIEHALGVANACGAIAVTVQGPMEGMPAQSDIDALNASSGAGSV